MDLGTFIYTWWNGQLVGNDEFGNRYFQTKRVKKYEQPKRWVLYKGKPEASKVPAIWHGWLHYIVDEPPSQNTSYPWVKKHLPNLTGTRLAHRPDKNSPLYPSTHSKRKAILDYVPWKP